jgi:hypothetical protein
MLTIQSCVFFKLLCMNEREVGSFRHFATEKYSGNINNDFCISVKNYFIRHHIVHRLMIISGFCSRFRFPGRNIRSKAVQYLHGECGGSICYFFRNFKSKLPDCYIYVREIMLNPKFVVFCTLDF